MTLKQPLMMQAGGGDTEIEYSALDFRGLIEAIYTSEGVTGATTSLQVTQRAAGANFSVDVATGFAVITGDDVSTQGRYLVQSTAVTNVSVQSPPVSGTATHRIIARVKDKLHEGSWSTYEWTLESLADGVAEPDSAITLAIVSVASGASNVTNANIADARPTAQTAGSRTPVVAGAGDLPGSGQYGQRYHISDQSPIEYVWNGAVWVMDASAAYIYKVRSSDLARTSTTSLADDTQLTTTLIAGLSYELSAVLLYTADSGGDFKFKFVCPAGGTMHAASHNAPSTQSGTSGDVTLDLVTESSTPVGGGSGTGTTMTVRVTAKIWSGSGGTFKLQWAQNSSSGTATTLKQHSFMTLRPIGT